MQWGTLDARTSILIDARCGEEVNHDRELRERLLRQHLLLTTQAGDARVEAKDSPTPPSDGEHRVLFADGVLSEIEHYVAGHKHGSCEYWYRTGQKKAEGQFADGEFTGEWIWWRENGELLQKGAFVEGAQHGFWQGWHDSGALMDEGDWVHGKRSGTWRHYAEDGSLRKTDTHPDRTP